DILSKSFTPSVARFFMLQAHYRSILDFSNEALLASEKGFNRLMEAFNSLGQLSAGNSSSFNISQWRQQCYDAMNDDFNSPILIANLFEAVKQINLLKDNKASLTRADLDILQQTMREFIFDVLGLQDESVVQDSSTERLNGTIELLIQLRAEARANRDFATSDKIRDQLAALGVQLKDAKEGTTFNFQ